MIFSGEADYLKDNNVVFGLEVNGEARAYPKRIMGWHEMFVDTVGGVPVARRLLYPVRFYDSLSHRDRRYKP